MDCFKRIYTWGGYVITPILREYPFFICFFLLIGYEALGNLHGHIIASQPIEPWSSCIGRILLIILWDYLFTAVIYVLKKRWIKILLYVFTFSLFFLQLFLNKIFGLNICPYVLVLLNETTSSESSDFIRTFVLTRKTLLIFFIIILCIVFSFLVERFRIDMYGFIKKCHLLNVLSLSFVIIFFSGAYFSKTYAQLLRCQTSDDIATWVINDFCQPHDALSYLIYAFKGYSVSSDDSKHAVQAVEKMDRNNTITNTDSLNVVLVIGESYIKSHAHIYGYSLPTTPTLDEEKEKGRLVPFSNVVSPYAYTNRSLHNMLCCNCICDGEHWYDAPYFPAVFKSAGYNVYFWDNQKNDSKMHAVGVALNSLLYSPEIIKLSYTSTNDHATKYDMDLIRDFSKKIRLKNKRNLIIFHLMGQHFDQAERFPHTSGFMRFKSSDIHINGRKFLTKQKCQIIADYDNATFYNDKVMKYIFEIFRDTNTILVYLSDHGEEVYDYRDSRGRVASRINANLLKYQYSIPFMIWYSDKYKKTHKRKVGLINESKSLPFISDLLPNVMFGIGNVKTKYYHIKHDLTSGYYVPCKRIVNDGYDYDSFFRTNINRK